jgi:hypothetical protein
MTSATRLRLGIQKYDTRTLLFHEQEHNICSLISTHFFRNRWLKHYKDHINVRYVDPLLGNDDEISNYRRALAK